MLTTAEMKAIMLKTDELSERVRATFGPYVGEEHACRLNMGCGHSPEPGFINLDRVGGEGADVVFDLERCGGWPASNLTCLPFERGSVDCVLASHVLEHIRNLIPVMREIHQVLKLGGYLCVVSPYASSDDAWEDPTHVRAFTEMSWHYFNRQLYEKPNHAGSYPSPVDFCFAVVEVKLVPFPDLQLRTKGMIGEAQLEFAVKKRFMRNVVKEMHAVLRKVED